VSLQVEAESMSVMGCGLFARQPLGPGISMKDRPGFRAKQPAGFWNDPAHPVP